MFRRRISHITRTILLVGSPANKAAQWTLAIFLSLVWIYKSEKDKPSNKGIFFREKKAELFTSDDIDEWNERYRPKTQK